MSAILAVGQNQVAPETSLWNSLGTTLKSKVLDGVNTGSALSSVVEHFLHTEGAAGSSPAARTISPSNKTQRKPPRSPSWSTTNSKDIPIAWPATPPLPPTLHTCKQWIPRSLKLSANVRRELRK